MDKFTKGILTVIAVGIIGLNVQMINGSGKWDRTTDLRLMSPAL